jgi:superfamily II DNA or RNA helicase
MAKLITNQKQFLSEVINNILPESQNLYFLIGYFYFSGFEEIYQQVEEKDMKILIGLEIEKDLNNHIKEYYLIQDIEESRLSVKKRYFKSFVEVFNDTDFFDSNKRQEAFKIFLSKLKNGSLEIKKTTQANHAKMYLFEHSEDHSQAGLNPGTMITGSSNLTISGLKNRYEINVILRDEYDHGKKLFDELWDSAIDIVNKDSFPEYEKHVLQKIWYEKKYTPYLFYVRVLTEYFSIHSNQEIQFPSEITGKRFFDLEYQKDAIKRTLKVLDEHDGVLISDVVGLGKSIIASAVAFNLRKKVIIIAPPHLHNQWDDEYRTIFNLNAKVFGSGSIDKALDFLHNVWHDEEVTIIVDEAHKYRNENTDDYVNLHQLCLGNKVMLLTATPFNNRPQDIASMIKLFQILSRSSIRTVDNLSYQFRRLVKEYKEINKKRKDKKISETELKARASSIASRLRSILEPVIVRRSRLDLERIKRYKKDVKKQGLKYVFPEEPILKEYNLGDLADLYKATLDKLVIEDPSKGFIGTRYKPVEYIKDLEKFKNNITNENFDMDSIKIAQINLAKMMRRLLVGRFESSVAAFKHTLNSMTASMQNIKGYYEKLDRVPIYKKGNLPSPDEIMDDVNDSEIENLAEYIFEKELAKHYKKGLVFVSKDNLKASFIKDLDHDIELLQGIYREWFEEGIGHDPKLENFKEEIKTQLKKEPNRKIVVFSEYKDTAEYIYENIKHEDSIKPLYYSGSSKVSVRKTILKNFDAQYKDQENKYNIIVATDALSEGVNLNRAGTIFNYDIPYNPTRVIQRVGRINRIGKMLFEKLYIYNYFPTEIGEEEIRKKEISTLKKAMIDTLLGEDTKVLTSEEELRSYFQKQYKEALANQESQSWDAVYQDEYFQLRDKHPEVIEEAMQIAHRAKQRRIIKGAENGVLVFGKKGDDFTFRFGLTPEESKPITAQQALEILKAEPEERALQVSGKFDEIYQETKSKLFVTKHKIPITGKKGNIIKKIEYFKNNAPSRYQNYFADLYTVAKELNTLPDGALSLIRDIDEKTLEKDIEQLIAKVPHSYLSKIITKANRIEEGSETLILAQEINSTI